ncbi:hypothetical protein CKN99_05980 [Carnobacterium maltaromaticum]|uniref:hypothetical protein n=2 Tax=Carnobacterium maltaromaticum TaxID=2751 RepID=UPI001072B4E7|nr:hypothetical protein [Carnobacterium maltaromaticum]MDT1946056.1 hypothetical protein [Carnobacterium maltaromaticum]MDT2000560.1 hypothetical protein [Carnobacterium maltaromaticum]TFJ28859.1 hypothetical protein CKN90_05935 [Carnobacterium maltaromaticum]TFJ32557.1 hypothetical protein CKN98_05945 [Carnobacterium maltaromaticum]TFJ36585.1 hypothetical protein CKN88_06005 [Carnobacterium maltaromaticum]
MKPCFVITMLDGEKIEIFDETLLVAYDDESNIEEKEGCFYSKQIYINSLQGDNGISQIATSSPLVGLMGLLSKATFFSIGDNIDSDDIIIYKTSAIKNIGFK